MKITFDENPSNDEDTKIMKHIAHYVSSQNISPFKTGRNLSVIHRNFHLTVLKLFIGYIRQLAIYHYKGRFHRNNEAAKYAADIYDFLIENRIVEDDNYIADTL